MMIKFDYHRVFGLVKQKDALLQCLGLSLGALEDIICHDPAAGDEHSNLAMLLRTYQDYLADCRPVQRVPS